MKIKILLWSIGSILIIGLAAGAYWRMSRPQVITFSDGSTVTLLGADFGKLHIPPTVKAPAVSINQVHLQRSGTSFITTNDALVVWVRQVYPSQQRHNFQYFLYDRAGTACMGNSGMNYDIRTRVNNRIVGLEFSAFPRRQGKFLLAIQENSNGGQEMSDHKFVIRNPARGPFTQWTPDPLPSTRDDDDVSVTLTKLVAGADMPYQRDQDDPDDPMNKGVQADFQVERNGKPVTIWQPVSVVTTDATGNSVNGYISGNQWQDNSDTATYQYGLWPDEPAWKIKFEFSQQSDFADNELWKVQNLPVVAGKQQEMYNYGGNRRQTSTNAPFAEADLNGFHLVLFPAKEFTDAGQNNWMQGGLFIDVSPALADGWRMTVKVTDADTNDIQSSEYSTIPNNNISNSHFRLQDIAGLTNLNVSIALHKSRFVEFTAKPEKPDAAASN